MSANYLFLSLIHGHKQFALSRTKLMILALVQDLIDILLNLKFTTLPVSLRRFYYDDLIVMQIITNFQIVIFYIFVTYIRIKIP